MDCVRRRGRVYCAVVTVPADLVEVLGKRQIWRSLKTKNYDVARSKSRKVLLTIEQLFQQIRNNMDSRLINGMVAEYGLRFLQDTDSARIGIKISGTDEYNDHLSRRAECQRDKDGTTETVANISDKMSSILQTALGRGQVSEYSFAQELAHKALTYYNEIGLIPDGSITDDDLRQVINAFATTERQLYKAEAERMRGITEVDSDFQYRLIEKWNKDKLVKKDVGIPLSELLSEYGSQWKNGNEARIRKKRKELKRLEESFLECFGCDIGLKTIDVDKAEEWRNHLQFEYHSDRGLVMTNKAVNNYIKTMSAVFNWARGKKSECCSAKPRIKYIEANPFSEGLQLSTGEASTNSRIFTDNELQAYVDVLADNYNPDSPEMTWLPLIMMYSGMRCNEVCQLYLDDIRDEQGIPVFRVAENVQRGQRVKCKSSTRDVPIHGKLQELGIMDYIDRLKQAGEAQLFPNCKLQKTGYYYSDAMCSRLNSAINIHISDDRKLRLYSLRANFRTAIITKITEQSLERIMQGRAGVDTYIERILDEIMGHSIKGGTGKTTYTKLAVPIKAEVMKLLDYGLDLSGLKII